MQVLFVVVDRPYEVLRRATWRDVKLHSYIVFLDSTSFPNRHREILRPPNQTNTANEITSQFVTQKTFRVAPFNIHVDSPYRITSRLCTMLHEFVLNIRRSRTHLVWK